MTGLTGGARVAEATIEPMATTLMRQTLAFMANPAVSRANAADTALLVLSADLSSLVWANTAASASFGLSSAGPRQEADQHPRILDQLSGSAGVLARKGRTSLLLRGIRGSSMPAELRLVTIEDAGSGESMDYALLMARAGRPAYPPHERDGALLREADLGDDPAVRLVPADAAASLVSNDDLPASHAVAAFVARDGGIAEISTTSGSSLLMARIAGDRIIVVPIEKATGLGPEPAIVPLSPAEAPTPASLAPRPASPSFRSNWATPSPAEDPAPIVPQAAAGADLSAEGDTSPAALPGEEAPRQAPMEGAAGSEAASDKPAGLAEDAWDAAAPAGPEAEPAEAPAQDPRPARRHSVWNAPAPRGATEAPERDRAESPENAGLASGQANQPTPRDEPCGEALPEGTPADDSGIDTAEPGKSDGSPDEPASVDVGNAAAPSVVESLREAEAATSPAEEPQMAETLVDAGTAGNPPADLDQEAAGASPVGETAGIRAVQASDFPVHGGGQDGEMAGAFHPRTAGDPIRFVWRIDSEGRFRSLSPEFAEAVGPISAAVVDRSVDEVARAYRLDEDGALRRLLSRRDTWSGRTVMWPLEGTEKKVPVDLAALPIYARDRSFDGFRGFGVVRLADAADDPDTIGLQPAEAFRNLPPVEDSIEGEQAGAFEDALPAFMRSIGETTPPISFGRRDPESRPQPPQISRSDADESPGDKIIRLEERRRGPNASLSQSEEAAFRAIGETLTQEASQADLAGAVRAASERIGAIEEGRHAEPGAATSGMTSQDLSLAETTETGLAAALERAYGTLPMPILVQAGQEPRLCQSRGSSILPATTILQP
ncbi:hypothetical protein [Jiella pelagia]|uniref:PAS domain-containing protein n=1 Tax=Jiella pelagia TaxID=2986949 RepID=A0ABY7C449_9HYPH|nr:hypothetical protein [Jiella pelagia]WAP69625.1 hypothetical protein OH818_05220 [Jiella pelagia]